jgi:hydroxymethylpyrimidine pyrophosphatase-like HAD family hydrolase
MEPVIHDGPEGEGHLITETPRGNNRALAIYLEKSTPPPRYVTDLPGSLQRDPVEIMFADSVERVRWLETELASRLGGRVHLARTEYAEQNWSLLDVLAEGASKADALSFLAAGHGIPHQRIMAIGDNWNDLGMLEACGLAVVMGNAAAGLRARGFETTATNDEAGVARAIDRYLF